jgi:hypothetical protein
MRVRSWPLACPRGNSASMKPGVGQHRGFRLTCWRAVMRNKRAWETSRPAPFFQLRSISSAFPNLQVSHHISIELAEINQQESNMASIHAPRAPTDFCLSRLTQCLPNRKFHRLSIQLVEVPKQARSECPVTSDRIRYQFIPPSSDGTEPLEATLRLAATTFRP